MPIATIIIFLGFVGYFLYQRRPRFSAKQVDYSFGEVGLQEIKSKISDAEYVSAESLINQLDPDNLRQVIDHVTLNGNEKMLLNWKNTLPDSQLADLFLGVFYMHEATLHRNYADAKNVSDEESNAFLDYSTKAKSLLENIQMNEIINAEIYARLVRILGTTSDRKNARHYFEKCIAINPSHLWAHIEYAEIIQPKWGGNLSQVKKHLDNLTKDPLVNQVIYLKMVWDSVLGGENLLGGTMDDLKKQAKELLFEIDAEVKNQPHTSIQKYVLYNYMTVVAEEFNVSTLNKKYNKLMKENFTLYPFGIMK